MWFKRTALGLIGITLALSTLSGNQNGVRIAASVPFALALLTGIVKSGTG
jgi:hypothetical protein